MNHVYRLLWSDVTLSFVVVAEHAKSHGKRSGGKTAAVLLATTLLAGSALAQQLPLPTGAQVSAGAATISTSGNVMTVNQSTGKAAINWDSFSIGKGATVNFVQPSASSLVLNRVVGNERSVIDGALNANGQVFLLNSNGVLFNQSARVNTAGLVASTLALSDADFNAGNYRFTGNGASGSVINFGQINAAEGGYAALLGGQVSNQGTITARLGTVALGAGDQVSLNFQGNSLVNVTVDRAVLAALVENRGAIVADGGTVVLTARAVDALMATVVNNTGEIRARTVANRDGKIYLLGGFEGGAVDVAGTLDASAPDGGNGGFIDTSGAHVRVADGTVVTTLAAAGTTGTWLIDPNDYTIAATGGNISGAQLASTLNNTNVAIETARQGTAGGNGDIFVNEDIIKTGGGATTLTLLAERDIVINKAISSTSGRLNVVATADADNDATGGVTFNAGGSVTTANGNFYAGAMNGNYALARGQDFTMQDGSFINVGMGTLGIYAVNNVTLAGASLKATASTWLASFYNDGNYNTTPYYGNAITVSSRQGAIINGAADQAVANIVSTAGASLVAGQIGTAAAPITLSAPAGTTGDQVNGNKSLTIENTQGSSYAAEIGTKAVSNVVVSIGSQANSEQRITLLGDTAGTGHLWLNTDGDGVLRLAGGDIDTSGVTDNDGVTVVRPTSVDIRANQIVFADNAVNTGLYGSYAASFSASAQQMSNAGPANGVAEINAVSMSLGGNVGTAQGRLEVNATNTLGLSNSGSAYVSATGNGPRTITLGTTKNLGEQSVIFTNGDHINISADGTRQSVATIGATTGIDLSQGNRSLSWSQSSGYTELDTNAINLGAGTYSNYTSSVDNAGGAVFAARNAKDGLAEITAGDVNFVMQTGNGAIAGIEIAKGGTSTGNRLRIESTGNATGDVDLTELSPEHFKSVSLTLYNTVANQIKLDLHGTDQVDLAVGADAVTLDAATVNLAGYNRNFEFYTTKAVQIDSVKLGSGSYAVQSSGRTLTLNSDVLTNGGYIDLYGSAGVILNRSVRIDSNADDVLHSANTGSAGFVRLQGPISASAPGYTLDVAATSSTGGGGSIELYSSVSNVNYSNSGNSGTYLAGLSLDASGVWDGSVNLMGGTYRLNGDFSSTGYSYVQGGTTIDTEQGNVGSAGNIRFAGSRVYSNSGGDLVFDASTTAAGFNGGNIDLSGASDTANAVGSWLTARSVSVQAGGGAGGTTGNIVLPNVSTVDGRTAGAQTYHGATIALLGDLNSSGGNILLDGDVLLTGPMETTTIDTWLSPLQQTGSAGSVTVTGAVSAAAAGKLLVVDAGVDTGDEAYGGSQAYQLAGGAVSLQAGNAGGHYLGALTINTVASGSNNTGTAGAMALGGVTTTGNQTYAGAAATVAGDLVTDGGAIDFGGLGAVRLAGPAIAFKTDMAGGDTAAGAIRLGGAAVQGASALTIDATADGGGAAGAVSLGALGTDVRLAALQVAGSSIAVNDAIAASGAITLRATDGAVTLNNTVNSTAGDIVVTTTGGLVNLAGSNALATGAGHGWQVWSTAPDANVLGGLVANYKQYNAQYGVSQVLGTGNGMLYTVAPTITASLAGSVDKTYDGSTAAAVTGANLAYAGILDGDDVTLTWTGAAFADANAGSGKLVGVDGLTIVAAKHGAQQVYGYQLASGSATGAIGSIAKKALTVGGISAATRVYDGTTDVALTGGTLSGLVGDETLALGAVQGTYADKNAGAAKAVTLGELVLQNGSGAGAGLAANYSIGSVDAVQGAVTARALVVGAMAANRVYDGSTAASVTLLDNRVAGDSLALSSTGASFADKNAGSGKAVTVGGIAVTGADAANYTFNTSAATTADIAQRALTVTATGASRVYDGSTTATVALADNRVAGDSLAVSNTGASFADKNAGSGKTVTVAGIALAGADAANYTFNTTAATTADITARALTVSATGIDRVYDGTVAAGVTLHDNRVAGDSLALSSSGASFADKNAGAGKAVAVDGITVTGVDAANYTFNTTAATTADITRRALEVGATAASRVYDGSTAASITLLDNRVAGDSLALSSTGASFADKNAGSGKAVTVGGIAVTGADAANYTFNTTAATTADIAQRALTVTATGASRVYDGSTAATVALADNRVAGDSLAVSNTGASFADKNAGSGKTVTVAGIALAGADAANYTFNTTAATTADITARALLVNAVADSKRYDGTTLATVKLGDNRVAGDQLTVSAADASFADASLGLAKTVTVSGIALSGQDAANYTVNTVAVASADVTSNAALEQTIGAVTNRNTVPTAYTTAPLGLDRAAPVMAATQSGFVVTAPMQTALASAFSQGTYIDAVMAPAAGQRSQAISQEQLGQVVSPGADGMVRVSLQRNGVTAIVDGGVRLPEGVAQQYFIVPAQAAAQ